jgi:hypothetical protein
MSALPPKADICSEKRHVRFVPKADIASGIGHALEAIIIQTTGSVVPALADALN